MNFSNTKLCSAFFKEKTVSNNRVSTEYSIEIFKLYSLISISSHSLTKWHQSRKIPCTASMHVYLKCTSVTVLTLRHLSNESRRGAWESLCFHDGCLLITCPSSERVGKRVAALPIYSLILSRRCWWKICREAEKGKFCVCFLDAELIYVLFHQSTFNSLLLSVMETKVSLHVHRI